MPQLALACQAMATRFEMVLHGDDPAALRAAGEEAVREIEGLEDELSLYRSWTQIARLNARAAIEPVQVSPPVFALLQRAAALSAESEGAFDITIAPLVRCWGFMHGPGRLAPADQVEQARRLVGIDLVEFNESDFTVRFRRPGVMLDLGAIGKGYAIERAVTVLREAGITSALLHGGTSTVYGLGTPPEAEAWLIAIDRPPDNLGALPDYPGALALRDEALSVSAVWAKAFEAEGKTYGHLIDPRTGAPADSAILAAVALPSATETDALSTALLVGGESTHQTLIRARPQIRTLLVARSGAQLRAVSHPPGLHSALLRPVPRSGE